MAKAKEETKGMNPKEFKKALDNIVKEKDIDPEVVYGAMELALTSAYKKNFNSKTNVKVLFDRETGEIKVYSFLTVVPDDKMTKEEYEDALFEKYALDEDLDTKVEEVGKTEENEDAEEEQEEEKEQISFFNKETEIKLSDAKKIDKTLEVGDTIDTEVTPKDFGRVAASTAKQVVVQKIREAERNSIMEEFGDKQDELLIGTVALEDTDNYFIDLGRTNGILPKKDCIPGEKIEMGSQIKVYVSKVDNNGKNLLILLSRTHYGFVKRLFELEIPEINDGTVMIYSVARDAGNRSKVAVYSENPNVDPIGACIGEKGSRIARIITELHGEKLDVVRYDTDPAKFIENALSPAKDLTVAITDPKKLEAMVIADGDNFSLAIGKKGQNARLATRLTKFKKIDIKTTEQAREAGINFR
ncbi:MAG: transcription termination/antitermination protein NusA [Bacilli bacterium]|nr:transcription termination/antitermination protein NusA [Bacilli bacterium]